MIELDDMKVGYLEHLVLHGDREEHEWVARTFPAIYEALTVGPPQTDAPTD